MHQPTYAAILLSEDFYDKRITGGFSVWPVVVQCLLDENPPPNASAKRLSAVHLNVRGFRLRDKHKSRAGMFVSTSAHFLSDNFVN